MQQKEQNKLYLLELIKERGQIPSKKILNSKNSKLLQEINECWPGDLIPASFAEKVYFYLYPDEAICKYGNHKSYASFKLGYNCCSKQCQCSKEKKKTTMMKKFGVAYALQSTEIKEKFKKTLLDRYGKSSLNQAFAEKRKDTNLKKYGVEYPLQSKDIIEKGTQTCRDRYGVNSPFELPHVKEAAVAFHSNRDRSNQNKKNQLLHPDWYDKENLIELLRTNSRQQVSEILGCSLSLIEKRISEWELDEFKETQSYYENVISKFLESNNVEYLTNTRKVISPKEIDFYIPSHSLAIEFNGLHWHSEFFGKKDRNYHFNKTQACADMGIHLIQIFQDEWDNHSDTVKSIILNHIKKTPTTYYARKLNVHAVSNKDSDEFINKYHLQGTSIGTSHRYGLYTCQNELLAIMTFKPVSKKNKLYEMSRYCVKPFINIPGGASRLLAKFKKEIGTGYSLITYSDNRYFTGSVYPSIGFKYLHRTKPNYWYFKSANQRFHRLNFTKKELIKQGFPNDKSEWEIMQSLGWDRIWDCGNTKWHLRT